MAMQLDVRFVTQLGIGSHARTMGESMQELFGDTSSRRNDPTGCWYASACMIGYYFGVGPRQGLGDKLFKQDLGNGAVGHYATGTDWANYWGGYGHHRTLARREELEPVHKCETLHNYTVSEIESLLSDRGPIFMYWQKSHGTVSYPHASVIIGTSANGVIYHDPENGPYSQMSMTMFNRNRQNWEYALMQRKCSDAVGSIRNLFNGVLT